MNAPETLTLIERMNISLNTHSVCGWKVLNTHTMWMEELEYTLPLLFRALGKKAMWTEALEYTLPS